MRERPGIEPPGGTLKLHDTFTSRGKTITKGRQDFCRFWLSHNYMTFLLLSNQFLVFLNTLNLLKFPMCLGFHEHLFFSAFFVRPRVNGFTFFSSSKIIYFTMDLHHLPPLHYLVFCNTDKFIWSQPWEPNPWRDVQGTTRHVTNRTTMIPSGF